MSIHATSEWAELTAAVASVAPLRQLLADPVRNSELQVHVEGITLDFARQRVDLRIWDLLQQLASRAGVKSKIQAMFAGDKINVTEDRAVGHVALRAARNDTFLVDGQNVVVDVWTVRDKIAKFVTDVRAGKFRGYTGKELKNVVAIGIGGSYLGAEFVAEALQTDPDASKAAADRQLRFLSNVDPVAIARATHGLNPEETLVVVISKTFTTAETMLNARSLRRWLIEKMGPDCVKNHVVAVSTALDKTKAFGIDDNNVFAFWDWVGGRYSVSSAVGVLPLSLQYGNEALDYFLTGARSIDKHFATADLKNNLPVILGLIGIWNASFLNLGCRALLPYSQALHRFAPHIQQVDMESNGKRVALDGTVLPFQSGPVNFGEPGTNGQHSFYQLIHQGRVVPCDFIGFIHSQYPINYTDEVVSNQDELMSNFFAQPDALALGKTEEELRKEKVPEKLIPHKVFSGNRPSSSLLFNELNAYSVGQLLALFEHRTVVEGFVWGLNSFDQWGVELGKVLASEVRTQLHDARVKQAQISDKFNSSTASLLKRYLSRL